MREDALSFTMEKSTVDQIRQRFDQDVERFSNLEAGQSATVDAPVALELVAKAAHAVTPQAKRLLDIGCGAGNFALRVMREGHYASVTLLDLSEPMLARARERILQDQAVQATVIQDDVRNVTLPYQGFDVVVAGAVLHHLRTPREWERVFHNIYQAIAPGGAFWIFDLVSSEVPGVARLQQDRYGDYLTNLQGSDYRDHVFDYIEQEDSPVPLVYQLDLLRKVGFTAVDILHFNTRFAAFGGVKL